jgi:hypothetical protein
MIAMIALFRICFEKLAETFFTPTELASNFVCKESWRSFCVWDESDSVRTWNSL